jgi:hypothetical protein
MAHSFRIIIQISAGAINGAGHGTGLSILQSGPRYQKTDRQASKRAVSGSLRLQLKRGRTLHKIKKMYTIGGHILFMLPGTIVLSGGI